MIFEFQLPLVSLIFVFILDMIYFSKTKMNLIENKLYDTMLISTTLFSLADTVLHIYGSIYSSTSEISTNILFFDSINKIMAFLIVIIFSSLLCYILLISYTSVRMNLKKVFNYFVVGDFLCLLAILLTNSNVSKIGDIISVTGSTLVLCYYVIAILILASLVISILNYKKMDKRYLPIYVIFPMLIIAYFITLIIQGIIIYDIVLVVLVYIMYFTIENPDKKMLNKIMMEQKFLGQANKIKSEYLNSIGHEIRNPLNAIIGLSECIEQCDNVDEIHEDIKDVIFSSKKLYEMINEILDISSIDVESTKIVESEYDFVEEIKKLTNVMEPRISDKGLTLKTNFDINIPKKLIGDKIKIKQVISNLLINSIKLTDNGFVDLNVKSVEDNNNCKLIITISDSSNGYNKEDLSKLFAKFDKSNIEEFKPDGNSFSLVLTKKIVDILNGKIDVTSSLGNGAKYTIVIDQKISLEDDELIVENVKSYKGKKALIVDDNKLNIKVAAKLLQEYNFDIDSALSGFECLDKVKTNNYDIIFMDIMMPKMNGIETFRKLRENKVCSSIVVLTADAANDSDIKYLSEGFDEYISKPIIRENLSRVLSKCFKDYDKTSEDNNPDIHKIIPVTDDQIDKLNELIKNK